MVQVLPKVESFGEEFGRAFGGGASQGFFSGMQQSSQNKQMQRQKQQLSKLTGMDLSEINDPKILEKAFEMYSQGKNKENEFARQAGENEKQFQREKELLTQKLSGTKKETENKPAEYRSGLDTISKMRKIRKKNNLGRGSAGFGFFGGETAKDRGEYTTLGNSLIQYASSDRKSVV